MNKFFVNLFYAFPAFSFAIPTFPVMILLPTFYSEKFGLEISFIGIVLFIARLIDIMTDPIMGWISDKNIIPRKFWLICGGLLAILALNKLFIIENIPYKNYLLIWISILYIGWTMFQIPYLSLGYDLESDYFARTKLSAMREFFILLGLFISLGLPLFLEMKSFESLEFLVNVASISGITGIIILLIFVPDNLKKKKNTLKSFSNLKKNLRFKQFISIFFVNSLANVLPMLLFSFFITDVIGGNDFERQKILFVYFLSALIGIPFWTKFSKFLSKKNTWSISLISAAFFFSFVLFIDHGDILAFIIISCLTGFCLGADLIIPPSIQADITDYHKFKFKEDISGVTFSSITFLNKFSFALGSIFVFGILGLLDFQTNTEINFSSKIFLFFSYAFLPIILKVFCYFMLKKFESSKDDLLEIQKKL